MKLRLWIFFALLLIGACSASAELYVAYHQPGYTGDPVPLETTVSFTFNQPLDITARWNIEDAPLAVFANDPEDSIEFGGVSMLDDNRTVAVQVGLRPNTEYCFIITNARAANGDTLSIPYAMSFSTRAQTGGTSVLGSVYYGGQPVMGTLVGLLAQGPNYDGSREARYATVVTSANNMFGLHTIRNGTYWLVAAWDQNGNGEMDPWEPFAEYDQGGDGDIDSIVVTGAPLYGLQLTLAVADAPESPAALPARVALAQNYPNPFNPATTIAFSLPDTRLARLTVFDVLGREIVVLQNGRLNGGHHTVEFDAGGLPSGLYFYRLDAGNASVTQKMLLMK